jgi:hypothetical protein
MPCNVQRGRPAPSVRRRRYATRRKDDQHAAVLERAARLGSRRDVDLLGLPGSRKVERDCVAAHLGNVSAAVEHDLEVLPDLADEPAQEQAVGDSERVIRDDHQRSAARDVCECLRIEVHLDAEQSNGVAPKAPVRARLEPVGVEVFLQAPLARQDLDHSYQRPSRPVQSRGGHGIRLVTDHRVVAMSSSVTGFATRRGALAA